MGTWFSGKRPLSNPNWIFDVPAWVELSSKNVAVLPDLVLISCPGEILMGIHDNILHIIVVEEVVPDIGIKVERIVEDENKVLVVCSYDVSNISVELFKNVKVRAPPWLVNWFESIERRMTTKLLKKALDSINSPVDVVVVDVVVA